MGGGNLIHTRWSIKINQNSVNLIWQTKYSMRRHKAKQRQANVGFLRSTPTSGDLKILYVCRMIFFYFLSDTQNKHIPLTFLCVVIHLHSTLPLESAGCWKHPVLPGEMLKSAPCWLNCVTSMLTTLLKGVSPVFNLFYLWAVINYSLAPLQNIFFLNVFNRGAIVCFVFIFFLCE